MVTSKRRTQPGIRFSGRVRPIMLALVVLCIAGAMLAVEAAGPGALHGDVRTTLLLQSHVPSQLGALFEAVNWLGITAVAGGVTALIGGTLLALRQPAAAALVLLTFPLRLLNGGLKILIESPRPTGALVSISERADGFGFPSGHTSGATLLYGMLFVIAPYLTTHPLLQNGIRIVALAMIALAGISRVYVGAHWPSDVVGGYLWGSILLLTMVLVTGAWSGDRSRP